jgi:phage/plasmid-like protein (TIGR03299 family)
MEWISKHVLTGFTSKRGNAWHHRAGTDNHFPGAVPMERVDALFNWDVDESAVYVDAADSKVAVPNRKAIIRSDTRDVLGIFADSYVPHLYGEWLVDNVSKILDAQLQIGSAGLLKRGAVGFVQIEMEETMRSAATGESFRPFLLAATSLDGSLATTYKQGVTRTVCDNSLSVALSESSDQQIRYRHTAYSIARISDAREALAIVFDGAKDFDDEVKALVDQSVTDEQFTKFMELEFPAGQSKRGLTVATNTRERVTAMYHNDERVKDFRGTAWGAVQAVSTYNQHERRVNKGTERVERNFLEFVKGTVKSTDTDTRKNLTKVLANA